VTGNTSITALNPRFSGVYGSVADKPTPTSRDPPLNDQMAPSAFGSRFVRDIVLDTMGSDNRLPASTALAGWTSVLVLLFVSLIRNPSAAQHSGLSAFAASVGLTLTYMAMTILTWRFDKLGVHEAVIIGAKLGVAVGSILVLGHLLESFGPSDNVRLQAIRGAVSLLLTFGLLGGTGSAAWLRTRSPAMSLVAGLWCSSVAAIILLNVALSLNLLFEAQMKSRIHEAFVASGLNDARAFLARNGFESASQIVAELSVAAAALSLVGCALNASLATRSRRFALSVAWVSPIALLCGVLSLWYAQALPRSSRPPFVLIGVFSVVTVICIAHPFGRRCGDMARL
jgi:hypothetical protein